MSLDADQSDMQDKATQSKSTTKLSEQLTGNTFRPSDFMRARHPELFSDSCVSSQPSLTKEVFEYHLELLTSRKEETIFEHFVAVWQRRSFVPISRRKLDRLAVVTANVMLRPTQSRSRSRSDGTKVNHQVNRWSAGLSLLAQNKNGAPRSARM